jgi:hypothetical protein
MSQGTRHRRILGGVLGALFILLIPFVFVSGAEAQDPIVTFQANYGGPNHEFGSSVQQTADGGYIITGSTYSYGAGESDLYLVKTDAKGHLIWQRFYGGPYVDWGNSVVQTRDGGYVVAGYRFPDAGDYDEAYIVKTDANGDLLWEKSLGGSNADRFHAVAETADGGLVFTGYLHSQGGLSGPTCLLRTDAAGNTIWLKQYGERTAGSNTGDSVQQTPDGGFIVAGNTAHGPGEEDWDAWLFRTDADGNLMWQRTFGGALRDQARSVHVTQDGGFVLAGTTRSSGAGGDDFYLVRTDASGNVMWERTLGGPGEETALAVEATSDGGFVVTGWRSADGGLADALLVKTDALGNPLWERTYGGASGDGGSSVQETSDHGLVIAGLTHSFGNWGQVYLVKTDANGDLLLLLGPGESIWVQTEMPAPEDFNGMTLFWGIRRAVDPSLEYNVYRPVGYTGGLEPAFTCNLTPFEGNHVVFEFKNTSGQVELQDDAWVWDNDVPGGMAGLSGYPFYFAFSKYTANWKDRTIVEYLAGRILPSEPPHGDKLYHHGGLGAPGNVRSDFGEVPEITVVIDIKPGDSRNSINLRSAGVVPVAILSSPGFDATTVNPGSIRLQRAGVKVGGQSGRYLCHMEDVNGDGLLDLVCQVRTDQLDLEFGDWTCVLVAETYGGRDIRGEDSVRIVPR